MNLFEKRKSPPGNRAFDGAPANGSEGQFPKNGIFGNCDPGRAFSGIATYRQLAPINALIGEKRGAVDFSDLGLDVLRSIYLRHIGDCKTEASRKPVPLDQRVAADLWLWKETTRYRRPDDWIFASPAYSGEVSVLARCRIAKDHSPSRIARRDQQKNYLVYLSTRILDASHRQWRKRKGHSGVDASRQPLHA